MLRHSPNDGTLRLPPWSSSSSFVYHRIILLTQFVRAMLWPVAQLRIGELQMRLWSMQWAATMRLYMYCSLFVHFHPYLDPLLLPTSHVHTLITYTPIFNSNTLTTYRIRRKTTTCHATAMQCIDVFVIFVIVFVSLTSCIDSPCLTLQIQMYL